MPRNRAKPENQPDPKRDAVKKRLRPLSPQELDWCDPNHELEPQPEPGDFDFEPDWADDQGSRRGIGQQGFFCATRGQQ